jgi:hypothetical protein
MITGRQNLPSGEELVAKDSLLAALKALQKKNEKKPQRKRKPKQVTKEQMEILETVPDVLVFDVSDEGLERLAGGAGPFCSICASSVLCSLTH